MKPTGFTTARVHADRRLNAPEQGAVHTSTTNSVLFAYEDAQGIVDVFQGRVAGHVYSRSSSVSVNALQNVLAELESAVTALCFSTGMAAISAALLSLLKAGDHIIVSQYLFGNTRSFMHTLTDFGIEVSYVDVTSLDAVMAEKRDNTRLLFTESIANPGTQVADLEAIGQWCQQQGLLFVVDNTMTPPPLFDAKKYQVSLIVCSLTKYLAGHGSVLGGAIIDTGLFDWRQYDNIKPAYRVSDTQLWGMTQIKKRGLRDMGATLAPASVSTILQGMETLELRMQRACHNAAHVTNALASHVGVKQVNYPGRQEHPQHQRACALFQGGFGAIFSIELEKDIDPIAFLNQLNTVICATHLGDTRTLALPVASTIFCEFSKEERAAMGIADNLIRVSVGIENTDDLIEDFTQALMACRTI